MQFIEIYWPVFLVALLIGAIVGYLAFRPRQRVTLTDNTPLRPHMTASPRMMREGRGLTDEADAAASDIRSEEHTSELPSLMRISYAVYCLKQKTHKTTR